MLYMLHIYIYIISYICIYMYIYHIYIYIHIHIQFAKQHHNIPSDNTTSINYCSKFLLFSNNEAWRKKQTESCFDVTMASFDVIYIYLMCFSEINQ